MSAEILRAPMLREISDSIASAADSLKSAAAHLSLLVRAGVIGPAEPELEKAFSTPPRGGLSYRQCSVDQALRHCAELTQTIRKQMLDLLPSADPESPAGKGSSEIDPATLRAAQNKGFMTTDEARDFADSATETQPHSSASLAEAGKEGVQ